jgi:hypothetical protein
LHHAATRGGGAHLPPPFLSQTSSGLGAGEQIDIAILKIPCKVRGAETPRTSLQPLKIRQDSLRTAPTLKGHSRPSGAPVVLDFSASPPFCK